MATTPPTAPPAKDPRDDAFIREVDEEYRRDEVNRLVKRYGRWVLLLVGLGLAALGAWLWWQAESTRRTEAVSEQFSQALEKAESGDTSGAVTVLADVGKGSNATYGALASLAEAGILAAAETEKAAGLLRGVADNGKLAAPLRDAAVMKRVRLEFDTASPDDTLKQLQPYLAGDNPWFPVAGEMAALAHLKAGNPEAAGPIFYRIAADDRAPASLRARAEQMAAMLGQDVTRLGETAEAASAAAQGAAEATDAAVKGANGQ